LKKILIVAAHPDDEILGCGGTIARYRGVGVKVKVLFIGEGSTCRYDTENTETALKAIKYRNDCALQALRKLGVDDIEFCNLPCGKFDQIPIIKINKILEQTIEKFQPDTIFTHSDKDANNDHKIIYKSTIIATRPCNKHVVLRLFCYEVLSSSEWSYSRPFSPNHFVQLNESDLNQKWTALQAYDEEMRAYPFPRSWEGVYNQAIQRGIQSGVKFAEAFELIREFNRCE